VDTKTDYRDPPQAIPRATSGEDVPEKDQKTPSLYAVFGQGSFLGFSQVNAPDYPRRELQGDGNFHDG